MYLCRSLFALCTSHKLKNYNHTLTLWAVDTYITAIIDVSKPIYRYLHTIHKTKSLFVQNVRKLKVGEMKHLPGIQKRTWTKIQIVLYYIFYGSRNTTWKLLNLMIQWYGHVLCLENFQYEKKDVRHLKNQGYTKGEYINK